MEGESGGERGVSAFFFRSSSFSFFSLLPIALSKKKHDHRCWVTEERERERERERELSEGCAVRGRGPRQGGLRPAPSPARGQGRGRGGGGGARAADRQATAGIGGDHRGGPGGGGACRARPRSPSTLSLPHSPFPPAPPPEKKEDGARNANAAPHSQGWVGGSAPPPSTSCTHQPSMHAMPLPSAPSGRRASTLRAHTHQNNAWHSKDTPLSPPLSQAFAPLHSPVPEALYPTLSVGLTSVGLAAAAGFFVCVWRGAGGMERERSRESRSGREKKPERARLRALSQPRPPFSLSIQVRGRPPQARPPPGRGGRPGGGVLAGAGELGSGRKGGVAGCVCPPRRGAGAGGSTPHSRPSPPPTSSQGFGAFFTLLWTGVYV